MDTNTNLSFRRNGYSVTESGHINCSRADRPHERTGILQVSVSKDTPATRAIVDGIIAAVDEPRALVGRDTNGGAVMLFHVDRRGVNNHRTALALRSGEEITITYGSDCMTLDAAAFTWPKGRGLLDVSREQLPPMDDDHMKIAERVAYDAGARPASDFERERASAQRRADIESGKIVLETDEQRQAREDDLLVEHFKDTHIGWSDSDLSHVVQARRRVWARKAEAAISSNAS